VAHSTASMDSANELNRPQTPPASDSTILCSTRDQRLQAQTFHDAGLTYAQIRAPLGLTLRQVQYAVSHRLTPKKRHGRPPILTQEEVNDIITWICVSKANRRTLWIKIPMSLKLNVGYYCVRRALRNAGFARRVARRKPPQSERNRTARLQWAIEHVEWTFELWKRILWSDET
jgi:transposase